MSKLLSGKFSYVVVVYTTRGFIITEYESFRTVKVFVRNVVNSHAKGDAFMVCCMRDRRGRITLDRYRTMFANAYTGNGYYKLNREHVQTLYQDWRDMFLKGYTCSELFNLSEGSQVYNPLIVDGTQKEHNVRVAYLTYMDDRFDRVFVKGYERFRQKLEYI
jgi:hypothetical protein